MSCGNENRPVALVTGAARGIGRAIALALAAQGTDLVVNDIDAAALRETVAELERQGVGARGVVGDIADVAAHERLLDETCGAFGVPDLLVNNAGISVATRGDMLEVTPESFDRLIGVNLRGPFFLTQALARRMLAAPGRGHARAIISVSSANATAASPDRAEYCLSKTGISMMTKLYAVRLASAGINVYEVRPGVIRTDMTQVARERYDALYAGGDFTPINRWGEPADVGRAVATLAGGGFSFSTGDALHVDGGLHIARL